MEFVEFDSYKELKIDPLKILFGNYIFLIQPIDFFRNDIKVYQVGYNLIINPEKVKVFGLWSINDRSTIDKVLLSLRKNFREAKEGFFEGWLDYLYNNINGVINGTLS